MDYFLKFVTILLFFIVARLLTERYLDISSWFLAGWISSVLIDLLMIAFLKS